MKRGKRYQEAAKLVDSSKMYEAKEALEIIEKNEINIILLDLKLPDYMSEITKLVQTERKYNR